MNGRMAVVVEYGAPFSIQEFPVPDPEPGAIVVKIVEAAICGSDLHTYRGDRNREPLPETGRALGHEGFGRVWKMGAGASSDSLGAPLKEGDRVIHSAIFPCGRCYQCVRGEVNYCPNGNPYRGVGSFPYFVGTFADYYYLPAGHPVFKVPDELADGVLAPINCAMGTVAQGLITAGAGEGQCIVIMGAGGLGLTATALARDMGAETVITMDRIPARLAMAKEFGADATINVEEYATPQSRIERVMELTRGRGADIAMELVGRVSLVPEGIMMIRNGGTFVEIGNIVRGDMVEIDPAQLLKGKRILGNAMYRPIVLSNLLDFLVRTRGRFPFERLVSHRFPLVDIDKAFAAAEWHNRQTEVTRAVLVP